LKIEKIGQKSSVVPDPTGTTELFWPIFSIVNSERCSWVWYNRTFLADFFDFQQRKVLGWSSFSYVPGSEIDERGR
jgi:hypothetical protein